MRRDDDDERTEQLRMKGLEHLDRNFNNSY